MHYLAGCIGLIAGLFYVIAILFGKAKPNRITWLIWFSIGVFFNISYYAAGARENMLLSLAGQINAGIILGLSIKYGVHKLVKTDVVCLLLAIGAFLIYLISKNAANAVLMILLVNFIGFVPTYVKTWREPRSEPVLPWALGIIAGILILPATDFSRVAIYIQPTYEILTKVLLLSIIAYRLFIRRAGNTSSAKI